MLLIELCFHVCPGTLGHEAATSLAGLGGRRPSEASWGSLRRFENRLTRGGT